MLYFRLSLYYSVCSFVCLIVCLSDCQFVCLSVTLIFSCFAPLDSLLVFSDRRRSNPGRFLTQQSQTFGLRAFYDLNSCSEMVSNYLLPNSCRDPILAEKNNIRIPNDPIKVLSKFGRKIYSTGKCLVLAQLFLYNYSVRPSVAKTQQHGL